MNKIGRKIYYDLSTGNRIVDTGDKFGICVETTQEEDFISYIELSERNPESVGVIQLEYGQYFDDFMKCIDYKVNLETLDIEFLFPTLDENGNEVIDETLYRKSLEQQINELQSDNEIKMDYLVDVDFRLSLIEMGLL